MRWRFLWRNPSVWCLELCNVYPARCRQPGVGAGTTDQWERWPGPPCRGRGCHRAQPRHSPVDGGSLPSHRGLDETTFLDNCTVLYCTVLVAVCCVLVLTGTVPWWGGGWRLRVEDGGGGAEQTRRTTIRMPEKGTKTWHLLSHMMANANDLSYHACILH